MLVYARNALFEVPFYFQMNATLFDILLSNVAKMCGLRVQTCFDATFLSWLHSLTVLNTTLQCQGLTQEAFMLLFR